MPPLSDFIGQLTEIARSHHRCIHAAISATIAFCQCFARRVNVMAAANAAAARFGNPLLIKGPSTVHGVVFALFVLSP
jgi:hypothetical protein